MKPKLKPPRTKRLKLKYDKLLYNFASNLLSNSTCAATPGALATLMPCLVCAHCHSMLLAGLAGCIICPAAPF